MKLNYTGRREQTESKKNNPLGTFMRAFAVGATLVGCVGPTQNIRTDMIHTGSENSRNIIDSYQFKRVNAGDVLVAGNLAKIYVLGVVGDRIEFEIAKNDVRDTRFGYARIGRGEFTYSEVGYLGPCEIEVKARVSEGGGVDLSFTQTFMH